MKDVVQTIKKLLALGERGGTEQEGQAAIEQARRLLAKHKLEEQDVRDADAPKEIVIVIEPIVRVLRQPEAWEVMLMDTIGEAFGTIGFCTQEGPCFTLYFMGERENVETSLQVIWYAVAEMMHHWDKIEESRHGQTGTVFGLPVHNVAHLNGYMLGYVHGLSKTFKKDEESTALAIIKPKEVQQAYDEMTKGEALEVSELPADQRYFGIGMELGEAFDHTKKKTKGATDDGRLSLPA